MLGGRPRHFAGSQFAESAASILTRWLQIANSTAIWSDGKLKIIPYREASYAQRQRLRTWTANTTPLYSLTDEDYRYSEAPNDPVRSPRADPYSLPRTSRAVKSRPRSISYNTGPITAFDQSAIDRFGLRVGSSVTAHEICDVAIGRDGRAIVLQRGLYIRNTHQFKLGPEFCIL